MIILLTTIHVLACFILVIIVLLQKGKGADLAGAFGGGGSQTAMGVRSASQFIHKLTVAAAVFFMLTSYTLGIIESSSSDNLSNLIEGRTQQNQTQTDAEAPATDDATTTEPSSEDVTPEEQTPAEQETPSEPASEEQSPQ